MRKRYVVVLMVLSNLLTFALTALIYSPPLCRADGNPFDCDDFERVEAQGWIVN